jgi:hypothetical protein
MSKSNWKKIAVIHSFEDESKLYTVKMNPEGHYGCNCPAWIFKHETDANGVRVCKHTKAVVKALGPAVQLIQWSNGRIEAEVDGNRFVIKKLDTEPL